MCLFNGVATVYEIGTSTTSATFIGNSGDQFTLNTNSLSSGQTTLVVPAFRYTLSTTTTVYFVGLGTFSSGTCNIWGRISAVRVG